MIVSEIKSGKILSMVSKPDFDPNTLAGNWNEITAEGADSVLINRATQGLYPPGSTFKLITMLEYIRENGDRYEEYGYDCDGIYELGNNEISCMQKTAHGHEDIFLSLARSCNCSFINMGLTLNVTKYAALAEEMLFNREMPIGLEYSKSRFVLNEESSEWERAQTVFGQGKTVITPFHLSLIVNAIANKGVLMKPYLVNSVVNCNGVTIKKFKSDEYGRLMGEKEAEILKKGMTEVIPESYSWLFNDCGYTVAGKSGSAQYGTLGYEHSLFAGFSPADSPEISVTVVIEGGKQRTTSAAEVSKIIYDGYYSLKNRRME